MVFAVIVYTFGGVKPEVRRKPSECVVRKVLEVTLFDSVQLDRIIS